MKKIYAITAFLCCATVGYAADKALQIEFLNGEKVLYALANRPAVTFSGAEFTIKSSDAETSYPRADVTDFTFVDDTTSAAETVDATVYSYRDNVFSCPDHDIEVYTLAGEKAASGAGNVSLAGLSAGVYIVRAANQSIKIIKN